jgi:taurine dioxygenase
MARIEVKPLRDDLPYGSRIGGVTQELLRDQAIRSQLVDTFNDRGVLLFEGIDQSQEMQLALSTVFGPLKEHPVKTQAQPDPKMLPGVIELAANGPDMALVEIDGEPLTSWNPWHFDHCYTNELNLAGVLRAVKISPEGGLTDFADGIQMYNALPADLRDKIENLKIVYFLNPLFAHMKFGKPPNFREITPQREEVLEVAKSFSRAIHPAVWTRKSGEKVLHFAPWMAFGIHGHENREGDALLTAVWDAMLKTMKPYTHAWKPSDMLIWDNTRMIHQARGCHPKYERIMYRTTIQGDYGLGVFEEKGRADRLGHLI